MDKKLNSSEAQDTGGTPVVRRQVGKSIPHDSAIGHVTGEALFIDDMPRAGNEVLIDCAGSPVAKGHLVSIDASAAREIPGVIAIYTHRDIPGHNQFGPIFEDENLLVVDHVSYIGEPRGGDRGGDVQGVHGTGEER